MESKKEAENEIFNRLARICSRSEECSPDIRRKIKDLGGDTEMQESIIKRLKEENFLDDDRYARSYVRDKFRISKWGRVKMGYYLRMKGLPDGTIEKAFEEIDEEDYIQLLVSTMKEKSKTVKKTNRFEKMGQIIRYAQGRGFEPELIHRYMKELKL